MRTLGLDLGTSSIGWAVVEKTGKNTKLIVKGVQVFEKGVGEEKNAEFSLASKRTGFRSARRIKFRRKLRKYETLKALIKHGMCPGVTVDDLKKWRYEKTYPSSPEFLMWLQTKVSANGQSEINPYYFRAQAVTRKMDLNDANERHLLGRAFYHLAQRRGYKSNRIEDVEIEDVAKEEGGDAGKEKTKTVQAAINKLQEAMNGRTLGQYYYEECFDKTEIRGSGHYTSRKDYENEFERIVGFQELDENAVTDLRKAIFFQRPLRSQKGTVGKCMLEQGKPRAPLSHPLFERYRAVQFINNIKVKPPREEVVRFLTADERTAALAWIVTRSKQEVFSKLAKAITPKKSRISFASEDPEENAWVFNYRKDAGVPASPTTARLISIFGSAWQEEIARRYTKSENKAPDEIVSDVWHAMFDFDDKDKLKAFAQSHLQLDDRQAERFAAPLVQGYASLSLRAIRKILPYLERGLIYSHAVFMANMPSVFKTAGRDWSKDSESVERDIESIINRHQLESVQENIHRSALAQVSSEEKVDQKWILTEDINAQEEELNKEINTKHRHWMEIPESERHAFIQKLANSIRSSVKSGRASSEIKVLSIRDRIVELLQSKYDIGEKALLKLYHPSDVESYAAVIPDSEGKLRLGSPRIASIKNPVFMRAMFRLRGIVNSLLDKGIIDKDTLIRIEMAREVTTAAERNAIYRYQREREKERARFRDDITREGYTPNDSNILKYQLWEEQFHKCLYTGKQICLSEFLGDNPAFDIEHTIPQSRWFDDSQSNLTLCDRQFNREIKKNRIPQELENAEEILVRAKGVWGGKIESLQAQLEKDKRSSRAASEPESKKKARAKYHYTRLQLEYWRNKLRAFEREDVPDGFSNSQLVDTRIISKYARSYLKSLFPKVHTIKASAIAEIKKIWGASDKSRDTHAHHCIDALVAACASQSFTNDLVAHLRRKEGYNLGMDRRHEPPEPWPGFAQYINEQIADDLLIVHHQPSRLLKPTFKKVRVRGKIKTLPNGKHVYARGDSVRGQLHKETIYGKIKDPIEQEFVFVVRRTLDKSFKAEDAKGIVDRKVRQIVLDNIEKLQKGEPIWFDEARGIPIKTVRTKERIKEAISLTEHRDQSKHEHKRHRYVSSGNNYLVALYRSDDPEARKSQKADWKLVSHYDAAKASREKSWDKLLPAIDEKGRKLKHILKKGTQLLFWEKSLDELRSLSQKELSRRLYKVRKLDGARIKFDHHLTAKQAKELDLLRVSKIDWGNAVPEEELDLAVNLINLAVEGVDFRLTNLGEIEWLDKKDD